jgi:UDP-N-acetylmuramoyl-tripeptide--D-alanyl-D-alanine ligase
MIKDLYSKYLKCECRISTDSRSILQNSIFFALRGVSFNGNKYAHDAIEKGAAYAVIDESEFRSNKTILVPDVLKTLQELANYHRKIQSFNVLAITGTNGKTTTKELIYAVLTKQFKCHATKGNLNNHIGVPLTILSAPPGTEILVVEMGANHINEIKNLCQIAEPDYGLITNIGKAHLEGFGGYEGVIKAKSELYEYLKINNKVIFVNSADNLLVNLLHNYPMVESYGSKESKLYNDKIFFEEGINTNINIDGQISSLKTNLFGEYNITNILAAIKIGLYFNISIPKIIRALDCYTPQNNRSQIINTKYNTVILDSYNANPSSMEAALSSFKNFESNDKILILGSMKELGTESKHEHQKLIENAKSIQANATLLVGDEFKKCVIKNEKWFSKTQDLSIYLNKNKISDKLIIVKGSRANKLEDIIKYL